MSDPPPSSSKPLSISLTSLPPRTKPAPKKRTAATALGDDSDDDSHDQPHSKVQLVTAFDSSKGGAVAAGQKQEKAKGPLVIPALKNKDWRAEAEKARGGRKKIWVPEEERKRREGGAAEEETVERDVEGGEEQKWGLVLPDAPVVTEEEAVGEAEEAAEPEKPRTEDEIALAALISGEDPTKQKLVISSAVDSDWRSKAAQPENEDDAYRRDLASRPDMPSLSDYAAVPVEEFGAALLRGMGWKGGEDLHGDGSGKGGNKKKLIKEKRPAFLGIGAKPTSEVPELGAWGKADKPGAKKKGARVDTTYIPVVMKNKKTGEVIDEKTLEERKKAREMEALEAEKEKDRTRDKNGDGRSSKRDDPRRIRDRSRSRERSKERERERRSEKSSSRRDRSRDRDYDRDRRRDDRGRDRRDRDSRRDGDRDRDRRDRRDRDKDRDRDSERRRRRSRSRSTGREKSYRR